MFPEFHSTEKIVALQTDGQFIVEESFLQRQVEIMERQEFHNALIATGIEIDIRRNHIVVRKTQLLIQNAIKQSTVMSNLLPHIHSLIKRLVKSKRQRRGPAAETLL